MAYSWLLVEFSPIIKCMHLIEACSMLATPARPVQSLDVISEMHQCDVPLDIREDQMCQTLL